MKFFLDFEAEIAELEARIQELRHVNNVKGTKILDITFKASDKSSIFEVYTLSQLKKIFSRGKIEVKLSNFDQIAQKISINQTLLKSLRGELKENHLLDQKLNFGDIKDIPGIFVIDSKPKKVTKIEFLYP